MYNQKLVKLKKKITFNQKQTNNKVSKLDFVPKQNPVKYQFYKHKKQKNLL